jgi:hypothetical protein
MEALGGRKFILSAVSLAVMLAVFVILSVRGTLSDGIAAILGGIVTAVLTQYGVTNVAAKGKE